MISNFYKMLALLIILPPVFSENIQACKFCAGGCKKCTMKDNSHNRYAKICKACTQYTEDQEHGRKPSNKEQFSLIQQQNNKKSAIILCREDYDKINTKTEKFFQITSNIGANGHIIAHGTQDSFSCFADNEQLLANNENQSQQIVPVTFCERDFYALENCKHSQELLSLYPIEPEEEMSEVNKKTIDEKTEGINMAMQHSLDCLYAQYIKDKKIIKEIINNPNKHAYEGETKEYFKQKYGNGIFPRKKTKTEEQKTEEQKTEEQ